MSKRTTASLALTKLKHVIKKSKNGAYYLAIPIDQNLLEFDEEKKAVYVHLNVNYKPEGDEHGQNGFISKGIGSKVYKAQSEEFKADKEKQKEYTPILGSIKDWVNDPGANDNAGNMDQGGANVEDDEDDLPF